MLYFQTKNTNFGNFGGQWKMLVYFVAIWPIFRPFGVFMAIWYVVPKNIWQPCSGFF
jgi:hypothetical protein